MVLAGTFLTGLIGLYIFPYGWSFNFAMTFGSILAATDPVAVSALMNEVGAPPRLQMHVGGESMLNDGSAVVFYTIFSGMHLFDINPEFGTAVDVAKGFAIFFQMSLGGAAIGIAFGLGLLSMLLILNRRLEMEENVIQVAATLGTAYTTFFVAEIVAKCSGVIAVVFCGITVKAFGSNMINDSGLMQSFWTLLEHLLNSVLFTLGGVVWGAIISNDSPAFTVKDWGYLFMLYALLNVIRFVLVFSFYPILSRIGLRSKWQEAVFLSFGGLRGAVGIALAISLTEKVEEATGGDENEFSEDVAKMFGMVGGISFLTLFINGTLCGPLIKKLGLVKSTAAREKIVEHYLKQAKEHMLGEFIALMTLKRFYAADFSVTSHYVEILEGLTVEELDHAVGQSKALVPPKKYKAPYLKYVVPYLTRESDKKSETFSNGIGKAREELLSLFESEDEQVDVTASSSATTDPQMIEFRLLFIEILQTTYQKQVQAGELDGRSFLDYRLFESLEFTSAEVRDGNPLNDWENVHIFSDTWATYADVAMHKVRTLNQSKSRSNDQIKIETAVKTALAFVAAHVHSQRTLLNEFPGIGEVRAAHELVIQESKAQVTKAKKFLGTIDPTELSMIISINLSVILLNKTAQYLEYLCAEGLLHSGEVSEHLERIGDSLRELRYSHPNLPGSMSSEEIEAAILDAGINEKIRPYEHVRGSLILFHGLDDDDMNMLEEDLSA